MCSLKSWAKSPQRVRIRVSNSFIQGNVPNRQMWNVLLGKLIIERSLSPREDLLMKAFPSLHWKSNQDQLWVHFQCSSLPSKAVMKKGLCSTLSETRLHLWFQPSCARPYLHGHLVLCSGQAQGWPDGTDALQQPKKHLLSSGESASAG